MTSPHAIDREDVMAYLDGELAAERAALVRVHLDTCESCRQLAADLRDVSARLHEWQVEPSPAVLDVTVRAALEASPLVSGSPGSPGSWWRSLFVLPAVRYAGMSAVAASAILAGWVILRPGDQTDSPPAPASVAAPSGATDVARLEQPAGTPGPPPATPGAEREQRSGRGRGASPSAGFTSAMPRQDAVSEVRVSPQPQRAAPVPPATADPVITNPPVSTVVPATPPPPPPPPPAPPPQTQTATAARPETFRAGAGGRGGGGGGGAAESRAITVDSTRNALDSVTLLQGVANASLIARRAELTIVTTQFDQARTDFDRIVAEHQAIPATMKASGDTGQTRAIDAVIRIPAERFEAAIKLLRTLGRVTRETLGSDDLRVQIAGLSAKLAAVQSEENALRDQLVTQRSNREVVLTTEQALARAREDRARLEAELRTLAGRVTHGELTIRIEESR